MGKWASKRGQGLRARGAGRAAAILFFCSSSSKLLRFFSKSDSSFTGIRGPRAQLWPRASQKAREGWLAGPLTFWMVSIQVCSYMQVICSQGSSSRLFKYFYVVSTQFPRFGKKRATDGRTNGPTDHRTNRPTFLLIPSVLSLHYLPIFILTKTEGVNTDPLLNDHYCQPRHEFEISLMDSSRDL